MAAAILYNVPVGPDPATLTHLANMEPQPRRRRAERLEWFGISALFAAIYFIQGICEPTEGLVAQPVRSLMGNWGRGATEIGRFFGLLGIPWSLKLVYGLLTDFVPLWGRRRRSYLLLANSGATIAFLGIYLWQPTSDVSDWLFLLGLLVPTFGVAFADVVVDGLMVEVGQPRNLTGRLQSVQWTSISAATLVMGVLGGWLSEDRHELAFLIAGMFTALATVLTFLFVHEPRVVTQAEQRFQGIRMVAAQARQALRALNWRIVLVAAFLFLWNFNPFASTILQMHMTGAMGFAESFYGETVSILALGSILGSTAYGWYCRRVRFSVLVHLSVLSGVITTACYWGMHDHTSARVVALIAGFTYMTGTLVQLDLAARVCPLATAATAFALLMSISNSSISLSMILGGYLYERWSESWGAAAAYNGLVGSGALATALCWLLVPWLARSEGRGVRGEG